MSTSQRVLDSIRRIVRLLREESRASEESVGLSGAQLFVLQKLSEARAQSVNELATRTATDQSSVSVVLARLTERGLVARRVDPKDRRRVRLSLTARGRALLRRSPAPAQNELVEAIEALRPAERANLADLLGRVVARMGEVPAALFFESDVEAPPAPPRRREIRG